MYEPLITIYNHVITICVVYVSVVLLLKGHDPVIFSPVKDGCRSNETVLPSPSGNAEFDLVIKWPETNIGSVAVVKCPCEGVDLGTGNLEAMRRCGGNFFEGSKWEEAMVAPCNFSDVAREICQIAKVRFLTSRLHG